LQYYLENTKCALIPQNIQFLRDTSKANKLGFTKTPKSTYNHNVRNEAITCKVSTDSSRVSLFGKENLSGQFSTILRHSYNQNYIDSTIPKYYFKKCTDKPMSTNIKIKNGSFSEVYPFKHSYICSQQILLKVKNEVNLENWFSFIWCKDFFPKLSKHDIYPDFQFTDSYNYLFDFDKQVEVTNIESLNKKLINEYFEVSCTFAKQEDTKCLLSVIVKLKQDMIPAKDASKIWEFVSMLDEINHLKINYKIL